MIAFAKINFVNFLQHLQQCQKNGSAVDHGLHLIIYHILTSSSVKSTILLKSMQDWQKIFYTEPSACYLFLKKV